MYKKIKFSASAMCFDWLNVNKQLSEIESLDIDYLHIDVIDGNFIPVEQKTGKIPNEPHLSHKIQLLAYIHLIESSTGTKPPYGALRYGADVAFPIEWNDDNRSLLMENIQEVQRLTIQGGAKRNHQQRGKCRNCSRKHVCNDSLS